MNRIYLILFFSFLPSFLLAQGTKEKLASEYLGNKEFDKASSVYEELLNEQPASFYYYENLLNCYIELKQFDKAQKVSHKQFKKFPEQIQYLVDEAWICLLNNNAKEGDALIQKNQDKWGSDPDWTQLFANALMRRGLYNQALNAYLNTRKKTGQTLLFNLELAKLYDQKGEWKSMFEEALSAIITNESNKEDVQSLLQEHMADSAQSETFKSLLALSLQKMPGNNELTELMIWYFTQIRDFRSAFVQLKLVDKKQKTEGKRILDMADIALSNGYPDDAQMMYQYVADLGNSSMFSSNGAFGVLMVRKQKIESGNYDSTDLIGLEKDYIKMISEGLGSDQQIAEVEKSLAQLQAFYLHEDSASIANLEHLIKSGNRLNPGFIAQCKLLLGDIYLFTGDYWEPVLLYGQVEKDFKEDPLGQEAKFRNARLSYYKGDFEWAEGQLSVLKTATTQLMANNAMELSLNIIENMGLDSNTFPLERFAAADLLIYQNKLNEANALLDSLYTAFPFHSLSDEILYAKARIARKQHQFELALGYLDKIISIYGEDILADNALFDSGQIEELNLNDKEKAKAFYEKLITNYPGSLFTVEARKRFRSLRGDLQPTPGQ